MSVEPAMIQAPSVEVVADDDSPPGREYHSVQINGKRVLQCGGPNTASRYANAFRRALGLPEEPELGIFAAADGDGP